MKGKFIFTLLFVLLLGLCFAETFEIQLSAEPVTGKAIPYGLFMYDLLEIVPEDFDANWDSIAVQDMDGNIIQHQIDDLDGDGKLSAHDQISFFMEEQCKIVISDDWSIYPTQYEPVLTVESLDGEYFVSGGELICDVKIDNHGFANYVNYKNFEEAAYNELGIIRIAGWKGSTFWADGNLGNKHEEKTSYNFKVNSLKIAGNGPVGVTFVTDLESQTFVGVHQIVITMVLVNGETFVETNVVFDTYADLMKLQMMSTKALTNIDTETTKHIMPLPRRLVFAEQLNITPFDYWYERDAIEYVNGKPYVVFDALDSMKPLWWGATYIFSSAEAWRANYSETLNACAYALSMGKPVVSSGFYDFVMGNIWVYESREFRDGIFRWMPGEFNAFEATEGYITTDAVDTVEHFFPGDNVVFRRIYGLEEFETKAEAIEYLEKRAIEIDSVYMTK